MWEERTWLSKVEADPAACGKVDGADKADLAVDRVYGGDCSAYVDAVVSVFGVVGGNVVAGKDVLGHVNQLGREHLGRHPRVVVGHSHPTTTSDEKCAQKKKRNGGKAAKQQQQTTTTTTTTTTTNNNNNNQQQQQQPTTINASLHTMVTLMVVGWMDEWMDRRGGGKEGWVDEWMDRYRWPDGHYSPFC